MILTIGDRQIVKPINSPQDAIEFAYDYSKDPAALFDLVHAKLEGDGADWVREALKGVVYGILIPCVNFSINACSSAPTRR